MRAEPTSVAVRDTPRWFTGPSNYQARHGGLSCFVKRQRSQGRFLYFVVLDRAADRVPDLCRFAQLGGVCISALSRFGKGSQGLMGK